MRSKQDQVNEDKASGVQRAESPRPAQGRCPHCREDHDPADGSCKDRILKRRRAVMPDYDEALKEWLS